MIRNTTRVRTMRAVAAQLSITFASFAFILFFASNCLAQGPAVPAYNSLLGANAKLFLDFNGVDFGSQVWSNSEISLPGVRPAYDVDGNANSFSTTELANIKEIWSRVAEAYAPFNINVTTVDPGDYNLRVSAHVVISGDNSWYDGGSGGVAKVGGFAKSTIPFINPPFPAMVYRTSWVFPDNLAQNNQYIADAAMHEAGHMFGLEHQSTFTAANAVDQAYDYGNTLRAPNMGVAYYSQRGLWAIGPDKDSATVDNYDMSVVGSTNNAFGFVPDEAGINIATAPQITLSSTKVRGVIGNIIDAISLVKSTDVDYYKLVLSSKSQVNINVDVAEFGPMLDTKLTLLDALGSTFFTSDPDLSDVTISSAGLKSSYSGTLAAGTYYLGIGSHGGFSYSAGPNATDRFLEDTGQYFITGSVVAIVPEPSSIALGGLGLVALISLKRRRR